MRMYINNLHDLVIGRMLDNKVLTVEIGCAEWKKSFPNLTDYRIEVTSPDGTVYFADATMKNDTLLWAINQNDTAKCGDGMFQIVATGEDGDRKSSDHPKLTIRDIMPGTAQEIVPDYAKPWTDKVSADADRAEAALSNARQASDSARIFALNAGQASADAHKAVEDVENISKSLYGLDANYTIEIPAGADFDNYTTPGNYAVVSGKIAGQIANIPRALSGRLTVYTTTEDKYVVQEYVTNSSAPYVYRRTSISGTWNDWHLIATMYDVGEIAKARLALSAYDAEELADYTDFDGLITPGNYRVTSAASAKTMIHIPRNLSGRLTVYTSSAEKYVIQEYVTNSTETHVYRRNKISDEWSPWNRIAMTEDALVLASKYTTKVEDNTDFDSLTTPGNYHVPTVETAETIINIPRKIDGRLTVFSSSEEERLIQAYITNGAIPEIYYRAKDANAWNPWYRVATTDEVERLNHALDDVIASTENEFAALSKDVDGRFALSDTDTEEIPAGADFDDYTVPGNYTVVSGKIASQVANIPRELSGRLTVYTTTEDKYVVQEYVTNSSAPYIYRRNYTSGKWNPWRKIATVDETINVTGVLVTPSNFTSYFTSYDDIPVNTVYNIAYNVPLENAPPGNTTLNSVDSQLEYMAGTVVTMSGSSDGKEIRARFQIFMASSTLIDQSVFCFRNAYTSSGVLHWSKWQKLTEVSALTASNIVIRKKTADRFFTDLDDAPINSIYQLDLDCDEGTLAHHPNPGQSCVLVTLGYSYVSRHGMVQMCFGLGGDTKMFFRYGYINGPKDYRWTEWKRTATMTDIAALSEEIDKIVDVAAEWINETYISVYGDERPHVNYKATDYIPLVKNGVFVPLYFDVLLNTSNCVAIYDENKTFISAYTVDANLTNLTGVIGADTGAYYARLSSIISYDAKVYATKISGITIIDGAIGAEKLAEGLRKTLITEAGQAELNITFIKGGFIGQEGTVHSHSAYSYAEYVDINGLAGVKITANFSSAACIALFDKYKKLTRSILNTGSTGDLMEITFADRERYMSVSCNFYLPTPFVCYATNMAASVIKAANMASDDVGNPLAKIITDGGACAIFRTIGVVGDSLSSGAMAYGDATDESSTRYVDMYEHSWIQYLARACGSTAHNFSMGGLSTRTFLQDVGGFLTKMEDGDHMCQAYFVALGHNDKNQNVPIGTANDIDVSNYENNADTYYGNYAAIISRIKTVQPDAKIFVICMKSAAVFATYNTAVRHMATIFDNVYVLDFEEYGNAIENWEYTQGHGNAMGYLNYAHQIGTYTDWIIRTNRDDFRYAQFIGTGHEWQQ